MIQYVQGKYINENLVEYNFQYFIKIYISSKVQKKKMYVQYCCYLHVTSNDNVNNNDRNIITIIAIIILYSGTCGEHLM